MKIDNYEIIKKDFLILSSLNYYMDKNASAFVYHMPIDNCSYKKYKSLAIKYFSGELSAYFNNTTFFAKKFI